jgi:hypothetical protein
MTDQIQYVAFLCWVSQVSEHLFVFSKIEEFFLIFCGEESRQKLLVWVLVQLKDNQPQDNQPLSNPIM